jgi:hypothetical protein
MDSPDDGSAADLASALLAENEELRRRNEALEKASGAGHSGWRSMLRAAVVVVLVILGALLATVSVPAIWGRNLVFNTDRYVETLAPLASDPGIQTAVIKAIDAQFAANVDVEGFVKGVLPPRAGVLAGPIGAAVNSLVDRIATAFVHSKAFKSIWVALNRASHSSLVAILTGNGNTDREALEVRNGALTLNLAPVVAVVKERLVSSGLSIASKVPVVGATIQIAQVKGLEQARSFTKLLNRAADWLPLIALVCFAGGLVAARRRRRTLVISALSVGGGMLAIGLGLAIGRSVYLDSLPLKYLTTESAGSLFDTMVRYLRYGLRLMLVAALLIALIAWLTAPSKQARALRHGVIGVARSATSRWGENRFAEVVDANRLVISIGLAALGALVLLLWTNPGLITVLVILFVTGLLVLVANSFRPKQPLPT